MTPFVQSLFIDLKGSLLKLISKLNDQDWHQDIQEEFVPETISLLEDILSRVNYKITSGELEIPELLNNNIYTFNKINEDIVHLEITRIHPTYIYGDAEHYFKRVLGRVYNEGNVLSNVPFVSTVSNSDQYFWAIPSQNIIAVPFWEEEKLLNLPDLYHEIGHLLIEQYNESYFSGLTTIIDEYFDCEIDLAIDQNRSQDKLELEKAHEHWKNSWLEAFSCDLIATFMVGPAYAWTNLKMTTVSHGSENIYRIAESHPSDAARNNAIFLMLHKLGFSVDLQALKKTWDEFESVVNYYPTSCYNLIFSEKLIKEVINHVIEFCSNIDLNGHVDTNSTVISEMTISQILNAAWKCSRDVDNDFFKWEKESISFLKSTLE